MKKIISKVVLITFITSLASCSSSDILVSNERHVEFQRIGETEILDMATAVSEIYENYKQTQSRSSDPLELTIELTQTEQRIAQQCERLTEEGIQVRRQLVQIKQDEPEALELTQEEFESILAMTDDQLASLALQFNVIADYKDMLIQSEERQIVSNVYLDCAMHATGITDIIHLISAGGTYIAGGFGEIGLVVKGTKMIINAKTVGKLVAGFATKYAGWFGIGVMLYDYISCVNSNK